MSAFSALYDISSELQTQVITSLSAAPDISFTVTDQNLVLAPPSSDLADGTLAILYLYHVTIDPHLRNQPMISSPSNPALLTRPPLPLQLRYLFVPLSKDEEKNQMILGRVLQHFHDAPTFRPVPGSALDQNRGGVPDKFRVRPDLIGFDALSQLWSAMAQPFRLSAGFVVDIVAVDSAMPSQSSPRIQGSLGDVRQKVDAS